MTSLSLKKEISIIIFLILILGTLAGAVIEYRNIETRNRVLIDSFGNAFCDQIALFCINAFITYDYEAIQTYASEVIKEEQYIQSLRIYQNNTLVAYTEKDIGHSIGKSFTKEITVRSQHFGRIELSLNTGDFERFKSNAITWIIIRNFTIFSILFLALMFFIRKRVLSPIGQLNEAVNKVAVGNYSSRLLSKSTNEIGGLAHSFNAMSGALREREEALKVSYEELRAANEKLKEENKNLKNKL